MKRYIVDVAFSISPQAQAHLKQVQAQSDVPLALRIQVDAGGCSGLKYTLDLEKHLVGEDDIVLNAQGDVPVVTDGVSLPFLTQATLDHESSLMGSSFVVKNAQAKTSCGCGVSFSI